MQSRRFLSFSVLLFLSPGTSGFEAEKGVIDLKTWNPTQEPILSLDGNWEFYWSQLIDPSKDKFPTNPFFFQAHSSWNDYKLDGEKVGGLGFATYRLLLLNIPQNLRLNLLVRNVLCACKVFVNGEVLTEIGRVGTVAEEMEPHYEDRIVPFVCNGDSTELVVQISNFHHRKGGFTHPFQIGQEEALFALQREQIMLNGVISSCYLFAGVFFLTLWIFRKKDRTLLFMSLFCLTIVPRAFTSNNYMVETVLPELNWYVLIHVEYLSMFLPTAFLMLFVRARFPDQSPKKLLVALAAVVLLEALISVVTPPTVFSWFAISHQYISLFSFGVVLWVIIRALRARVNGALFGGIAIVCLITWAVMVILHYLDFIGPLPYAMTGLQVAFLLSMSLILGAKFSSQFTKVERLQETTEQQRAQLELQKKIVEVKNEEILASISYAKRIQDALLPPGSVLSNLKPDSFILYLPKDIVAGDFYWIEQKEHKLYFAVADCTGHGVPGALVSVVCHSALNRALREFGISETGRLLDKTRELILEAFGKGNEEVKDGMDIALCSLDIRNHSVEFSGANNPLCIMPKNNANLENASFDKKLELDQKVMFEFKGSKQPVGPHPNPRPFETLKLQLAPGDIIYLFSDGYPDQFGELDNKKMMYRPFKKLLLEYSNLPFDQQRHTLEKAFNGWKGDVEQTDDVCVIGLRI